MDCIAPRPAIHTLRNQGFIEAKMFECFYLLSFGREPFSVRHLANVIDDVIERQKPPPYLVLGRGAAAAQNAEGAVKLLRGKAIDLSGASVPRPDKRPLFDPAQSRKPVNKAPRQFGVSAKMSLELPPGEDSTVEANQSDPLRLVVGPSRLGDPLVPAPKMPNAARGLLTVR